MIATATLAFIVPNRVGAADATGAAEASPGRA